MIINKSKTAEIYRNGNPTNTWHSFLKDALNAERTAFEEPQNSFLEKSFLSPDYDVNQDSIELYLEDSLPENLLKTYNKYDKALSGILPGLPKSKTNTDRSDAINWAASIADLALQGISGATGGDGFSIDPWIANMKTWKGISGEADIQFDYTFYFRMGQYNLWNAKEEVVKPILNLMAPTMIKQIGWIVTEGPYPTTGAILGKFIKDIDFDDFTDLNKDTIGNLQDIVGTIYEKSFGNTLYTIRLGNYILENAIIEDSTIQWSQETDQNYFPIAGSIRLKFYVPFPATMYVNGTSHPHSIKFKPPGTS